MEGKVYVLLLNWNGWRDTIACLESIFRSTYPSFRVIVCDNASTDGSVDQIKAWARGELLVPPLDNSALQYLIAPPLPKPIPFVEYDRRSAESGGNLACVDPPLILIRTGGNLGFAGGCNVGLRYALARNEMEYVWLLNNDTVVAPDALAALVARMTERKDAGQCGARLLYYYKPDTVQALGGASYNRWLAWARPIGGLTHASRPADVAAVERKMDYVSGASLFVRRSFLSDVGLLNEEYFLFKEEIDWAVRARGKYGLAYADRSIVYHKHGGSTVSGDAPLRASRLADFYGIRSRLKFTRKYYPLALPTVQLGLTLTIISRLRRGQFASAVDFLRMALSRSTYSRVPGALAFSEFCRLEEQRKKRAEN